MLNDDLQRVMRLYAFPSESLHSDWWEKWGLALWQSHCDQLGPAGKRAIDMAIIERRGITIDQVIPTQLTQLQSQIVSGRISLYCRLVALGLCSLNRVAFMHLRAYRHTLLTLFSKSQLDQIAALARGNTMQLVGGEAAYFVSTAYGSGFAMLDAIMSDDIVWKMVKFTLPINTGQSLILNGVRSSEVPDMFIRLERFL
jgi:hypothetical protein